MNSPSRAAMFRALTHARRSTKRFEPDRQLPAEVLQSVLESTIRSPSSFNLQPMQIILVQDSVTKEKLASDAMLGIGNQFRTKDCSALTVFLADLEAGKRIARIQEVEKGKRHPAYANIMPLASSFLLGEGHAATLLKQVATDLLSSVKPMPQIEPVQAWAYKNTALAVQSYVLACTSYDLATCVMEGFDARRVKEILRVPDRYGIPMAVATGYQHHEEVSDVTLRLPLKELVFQDSFGVPWSYADDADNAATA